MTSTRTHELDAVELELLELPHQVTILTQAQATLQKLLVQAQGDIEALLAMEQESSKARDEWQTKCEAAEAAARQAALEVQAVKAQAAADVEAVQHQLKVCNKDKELLSMRVLELETRCKLLERNVKASGPQLTQVQLEGLKASAHHVRLEWSKMKDNFAADMTVLQRSIAMASSQLVAVQPTQSVSAVKAELSLEKRERAVLEQRYRVLFQAHQKAQNQLVELRGNVRVYCRIRPLPGAAEARMLLCTPSIDGVCRKVVATNPANNRSQTFVFDQVFDTTAVQSDVFVAVEPTIMSVLAGYNVCLLAYGQTGSGKTYTMEGHGTGHGLIGQTAVALFERVNEHCNISVQVSCLEVYNEEIRDLFHAGDSKLELRGAGDALEVPNKLQMEAKSAEDVMALLRTAFTNRTTHATAANDCLWMNHSVFTLHVHTSDQLAGTVCHAKLHFVDLAGSERIAQTQATGDRLREAQHINKSLSALGQVFNSLLVKAKHIPYRNSKLTMLLRDSLGGDAKAIMIVCVQALASCASETHCSLAFGTKTRKAQLGPATKHAAGASSGSDAENDEP